MTQSPTNCPRVGDPALDGCRHSSILVARLTNRNWSRITEWTRRILFVTETIETQLKPAIYELPFLLLAVLNSLINPFLYFKIMTKMNFCRKCKRTSVQNNRTRQVELSSIKAQNPKTPFNFEKIE